MHTCEKIMMTKLKLRYLLLLALGLASLWTLHRLMSTNDSDSLINLNELHSMGACLLNAAGRVVVDVRHRQLNADVRKKADDSVVTQADVLSHTIIVHALQRKYPHLRVNSEESESSDGVTEAELERHLARCDRYEKRDDDRIARTSEISVWVDPLDATQEYSENLVDYVTLMFCIVQRNVPRAVSSFYENKNLKENAHPIRNRIIVSRSHAGEVKSIIGEKLQNSEIIIAAGSGYKTLSLLENRADLYLHSSKIFKWDVCAPNAILNNLGGKLTKRNGQPIDYVSTGSERNSVDGIIASLFYYDYYFSIFKKD